MSDGFDAAIGAGSVTQDETAETPTSNASCALVGAKVVEVVTAIIGPRESFEERRDRMKAERKSFLTERQQRSEVANQFLRRFAMQLAKAVNDLALRPMPEERWTPQWEESFLKVWHEILFRKSVQRALVLAKCELQELDLKPTSTPALSLPHSAAHEYTDARCLGFLYAAFGRALERPKTNAGVCDITFRHDGPEYITRLRRWDPSGRRSIQLYRKWTEGQDQRRISAVAHET